MIKKLLSMLAISSFSLSVSAIELPKEVEKPFDLGFSQGAAKLTLDRDLPQPNSLPTLQPSVVVDNNVTIAEFSSSMNCSTGDISVNAAIPEISNFKDALKILAPYAVGENGDVDFGNFLSEMLTEFAIEESTESMLEYLAYIHYYITASMGEFGTPDVEMFKASEFKSCVAASWAKATETDVQVGGSVGAIFNDFGGQIGLDVTALFELKSCFKKAKGPIFASQEEEERFQQSLKIVRAIFYKLLNGQLNFDLKQQSDVCKAYQSQIAGNGPRNTEKNTFLNQMAHGGTRNSPDGSRTVFPAEIDEITVIKRADAEESSISAKRAMEDTAINQTAAASADGTKALSTGSVETERLIDLKVKMVYQSAPYTIDIIDMNPKERINLYSSTTKDFLEAIEFSDFYGDLSSESKYLFPELLKAVTTTQGVNYKHVEELACALDENKCQLGNSLTEADYRIMMDHNGFVNQCIEKKKIAKGQVCIASKPNELFDQDNSKLVTSRAKQRAYMQKKINLNMLSMIEDYYLSLGAFVFAEDFDSDDLDIFNSVDYLKNKIVLLKKAKQLKEYWSRPFATLSPLAAKSIAQSQSAKNPNELQGRSQTYKHIKDIFEGRGGSQISLTPYIYEPMNELQMAKYLHMMSNPARINLLLAATDADGMGRAPVLPMTINNSASGNIFQLIQNNNYKSITDSVQYNGFYIHPTINNIKRNNKYSSPNKQILDDLAILLEKYKDFYIKRLVDALTARFDNFKAHQMDEIHNNSTPAAILTTRNEMNIIDFKQQQRREMLNLLLN